MILDSGVCTLYTLRNVAAAGAQPQMMADKSFEAWYADIDFVSEKFTQTAKQRDEKVTRKIRVIETPFAIVGNNVRIGGEMYSIIRVFHGRDDDSGELIADVSLTRAVSYNA